ncbi:unnamed protein product, partial [marine sediment metagenome]
GLNSPLMWFGLLFLAAVTSSLSMLQPAIAFLEDGFGLGRRASVAVLGVVTAMGAGLTMFFSKGLLALDHTDFWCNLMMIIAATCQVLVFGWVIGAARGVKEMNRGADFQVPRFIAVLIRYVTPAFLLIILGAWSYVTLPDYLAGMSPKKQAIAAERGVYEPLIRAHFADDNVEDEALHVQIEKILGLPDAPVDVGALPEWLTAATVEAGDGELVSSTTAASDAASTAAADANIARFVLLGIVMFLVFLYVLSDIACRNRIGRMIQRVEQEGIEWGNAA